MPLRARTIYLSNRALFATPVSDRMRSTSSCRYGVPSARKISWNQTVGSRSTYGRFHESHGKYVCVFPATNPQLKAATLYFFATGSEPWNVLPFPRAMYSVQRIGRSIALQPGDPLLELLAVVVVVEGDHVRRIQLDALHRRELVIARPVSSPDTRREGLLGASRPCPLECLRQQREHELHLPARFLRSVAAVVRVVRLVPDVPAEDPLVPGEGRHDASYVGFEARVLRRILQGTRAGALQPAGIVHAWFRVALAPELRERIPAGIEQHQQRSMSCFAAMVRNGSIRWRYPAASCCHSRSCRNTRMVVIPRASAHPSSVSIRFGSNVSACHISSSLMALAGM